MSQAQSQKAKRIRRTKQEIAESNELFVKAVQANKDLLFGPLSPTVTAAMKDTKWEEIRKMLVDKGDKLLVGKNSNYIKTTFWQNVRRDTMERRDAIKVKTGAEPKDAELSPVGFLDFLRFYSLSNV